MTCLFGDSTDSDLDLDYLYLVRDVIAFSVDVLLTADRIDELDEAVRASQSAADGEKRKLEALRLRLEKAMAAADGEDAAARCASAISRAGDGAVADEIRRIDAELDRERGFAERSKITQRKACERALERLLLMPHRLPEGEDDVEVSLVGEHGYTATLRSRTPYGLAVEVDLDIPEGNLFGTLVRAQQVAPTLEVHVPETRGWISKKIKPIRHKLGKFVVTRVRLGGSRVTVSLRPTHEGGDGFDLILDADWTVPRVVATTDSDPPDLMTAHDLDADDEPAVRDLLTTLVDATEAIRAEPCALSSATLDGIPLSEHEDPTELVDRLVELMAPTVRAISEHSLGEDELVLKRSIGQARREEIYVSKRELVAKLEALRPEQRIRFASFGIIDRPVPSSPMPRRPPARGTAPPPVPGKRSPGKLPAVMVDASATRPGARAESEA